MLDKKYEVNGEQITDARFSIEKIKEDVDFCNAVSSAIIMINSKQIHELAEFIKMIGKQ